MTLSPKRIPIGVDNFKELVNPELNHLYIDKTLMLKELIDKGTKVSLIIRPRRWGKTINMSMIQHFFSPMVDGLPTKGIFDHLKIASVNEKAYLEHQGKHPVLFISFKDAKQDTFKGFIEKTNHLIQNLCNQYAELLTSPFLSEAEKTQFITLQTKTASVIEVCDALQTLSVFLYKHYQQTVYILIDEYDTPLNAAYGKTHFEELVNFFKGMFGVALKGNNALEKGIMTGILRLSKNKMLSDLNNLTLYSSMEEQYSQYFGFSEEEVQSLFSSAELTINIEEIRGWYNGYASGLIANIYNPWSILNCINNNGTLKPYWIKTGNEDLLRTIFLQASISVKEKLNLLLIGQPIESIIDEYCSFDQIEGNETALWSLLWALGYLKTIGEPKTFGTRYKYQLKIPNHEVASSFRDVFQTFMNTLPNVYKYDSFLNNLSHGNIEIFIQELTEYMSTIPSWFDFPQESNYHTFLLGLTASLGETHHIYSNREIGYGRPDILLLPRDVKNNLGIILEFKKEEPNQNQNIYEQSACKGLAQIDIHQYDSILNNTAYIRNILKMCIVFYGKQFICQWTMNEK
jgi:hypothetical protein